jgi:HK97 family phage major capsid protein
MDFSRMSLSNLKREKTNKVFELQELHERSQSNFTNEDQKQWDNLKLDIEEIESNIRKAEVREQVQKNAPFVLDQNNAHKFLKGQTSRSKNILGRILKATQSNADEEVRGLTSTGGTTMIPADRIQEVIFDLESQNDLANAGASFILSEQNFQWPRVTNKGTAYYQAAELDAITDSSPTIGSVKADLKDVAIRFIVSNQLLLDSSENVERILQNAMIEKINQTVLEAVFSGSGSSGQPTGLDNLSGILTVDASGGKLTDYKYHIQAVKKLLDANMRMENLSVFGSPDSLQQLEYLTDTTGQPIMQPKMIDRLGQYYTSAIATDYGATTDETKLYLGDFSRLLVAYQGPFTILTDQSASKLATEVIMHYRFDLLYLSPDSFCRVDNIETGLPA